MDPSKFFKNIKNLLIVVLIVVILLLRQCGGKEIPGEDVIITKIETEIEIDTISVIVPKYIPQWRDKYLPSDTTYLNVDTAAILQDYLAAYLYSDTIADDSVRIIINDSITRNQIAARDLKYEILYPIKTITITEEHYLNKREFYVGPRIGASLNALEYVGVEAMLKTKKRTAIGLGIGVDQTFQPQLQFGIYWKLSKKQ